MKLQPSSRLSSCALLALCTLGLGLHLLPAARAGDKEAPERRERLVLSPEEREILSHLSIEYLDDGQGGTVKTIRVSGANLQIVNGLGATNGYPLDPGSQDPLLTSTNGTGNLIVGYNELGNGLGDDRTGSHNLVVGAEHSFDSYGGFVGGYRNFNGAPFSSLAGGATNRTLGIFSSIGGGQANETTISSASIAGGFQNVGSGQLSTVVGGAQNEASASFACVVGGQQNTASASSAVVTGGLANTAAGFTSVVSGGSSRQANNSNSWVAGSLLELF